MEDPYSKYVKALEDEALLKQLLAQKGLDRPGLEEKILMEIEEIGLSKVEKTVLLCAACLLFCIGSYWGYSATNYFELANSDGNIIFYPDGLSL
ncbi:MAG: hypothetical protein HRU09_13125 [Oligoflexales bacterium]|nr:hypothetical protein [Oligoflexales bacterium]